MPNKEPGTSAEAADLIAVANSNKGLEALRGVLAANRNNPELQSWLHGIQLKETTETDLDEDSDLAALRDAKNTRDALLHLNVPESAQLRAWLESGQSPAHDSHRRN